MPNVDFYTVGASGISDTADMVSNQGPKTPYYSNNFLTSTAPHGFAIVQLYKDRVRVTSYCDDDRAPLVVVVVVFDCIEYVRELGG